MVFGKILNIIGQIICFGLIYIAIKGQILKKYRSFWSHWFWCRVSKVKYFSKEAKISEANKIGIRFRHLITPQPTKASGQCCFKLFHGPSYFLYGGWSTAYWKPTRCPEDLWTLLIHVVVKIWVIPIDIEWSRPLIDPCHWPCWQH